MAGMEPRAPAPPEAPPRVRVRGPALALAAAAAVVVAVAWALPGLVTMIACAFLIAYLLDPAIDWFEDRGVNRTVAVVGFVTVVFVVLTILVLLVLPIASRQVVRAVRGIPDLLDWIEGQAFPWIEATFGFALPRTISELSEAVRKAPQAQDLNLIRRVAETVGQAFSGTLGAVLAVLNWVLVPVFSVYFLREFDRIVAAIDGLVPSAERARVREIAGEIDEVLGDFIRGQLVVTSLMAVLYAAGLALAGIDLWLLTGIVAGFGNLVPYLGTTLGLILGLGAALIQHGDLVHLAGVAAVFAAVQFLEGFVLTPRIVGDRVGLHPVVVMIAILAGGELFGFLGILLAVPMTAVGGVFVRRGLAAYRASDLFARAPEPDAPGPDASGARRD